MRKVSPFWLVPIFFLVISILAKQDFKPFKRILPPNLLVQTDNKTNLQECLRDAARYEQEERARIRREMCGDKPPEQCGPIDLVNPTLTECYRKYPVPSPTIDPQSQQAMTLCKTDADCVFVDDPCSVSLKTGRSCLAAVNKNYSQKYQSSWQERCKARSQPTSCQEDIRGQCEEPMIPVCLSGSCIMNLCRTYRTN